MLMSASEGDAGKQQVVKHDSSPRYMGFFQRGNVPQFTRLTDGEGETEVRIEEFPQTCFPSQTWDLSNQAMWAVSLESNQNKERKKSQFLIKCDLWTRKESGGEVTGLFSLDSSV